MVEPEAVKTKPSSAMFSIERSEFDRLQTQLIDLRTVNYTLKEENAKLKSETTQLQSTVHTQTRELDKANKTIQRSKKAKELSALIEENDSLQRKIDGQEKDFSLQTKTLMDEISKVMEEKEVVGSELANLRLQSVSRVDNDSPGRGVSGGVAFGEDKELTLLKAENAALQRSLQSLQEKFSTENVDSSNSDPGLDPTTNGRVLDLELKLATEEEEKKLLREQLEELQSKARKQQTDLQSELDKWVDKAKKKQDSLLHLQEEKEKYYVESKASYSEMVRSKDHQIQTLQSKLDEANSTLTVKSEASMVSEEIAKQLETLSTEREELNLRCSTMIQDKEALVNDQTKLEALLKELGNELQHTKARVGEERRIRENLSAELEEAKLSQEQLADQVVCTSEKKHKLQQDVDSIQKVAEKRKALLDELSIKGQLSATEQQRKLDDLEEKHSDNMSRIETILQREKSYVLSLTEANEDLPLLREKVKSLEETNEELEERVRAISGCLESEREVLGRHVEEMKTEHEDRVKGLTEQLDHCRTVLTSSQERMAELETEVEDRKGDVKVVERKAQALLKDLKYQLKQMQKREERLQGEINQLRGGSVLDYSTVPSSKETNHDSTSRHSRESSLSSLRGLFRGSEAASGGVELNTPSSVLTPGADPTGFPGGIQFSAINEETKELLERIAHLQKEKWALEERVGHLESTGSALAEDVIRKSEIIKTFYTETKADHSPVASRRSTMSDKMSPMRLMNWAKGGKDETVTEINRRMQRALEEALTKNIHLHKNIEMLSAELEKWQPQAFPDDTDGATVKNKTDLPTTGKVNSLSPTPSATTDDQET